MTKYDKDRLYNHCAGGLEIFYGTYGQDPENGGFQCNKGQDIKGCDPGDNDLPYKPRAAHGRKLSRGRGAHIMHGIVELIQYISGPAGSSRYAAVRGERV